MKKVIVKIVFVDNEEQYLVMCRNDHVAFANDPDLPGGKLDEGESHIEALIREVREETGLALAETDVEKLYEGDEYSAQQSYQVLYFAKLGQRPVIQVSPEHTSYEWLPKNEFLKRAKSANDTFMHMAHDMIVNKTPIPGA